MSVTHDDNSRSGRYITSCPPSMCVPSSDLRTLTSGDLWPGTQLAPSTVALVTLVTSAATSLKYGDRKLTRKLLFIKRYVTCGFDCLISFVLVQIVFMDCPHLEGGVHYWPDWSSILVLPIPQSLVVYHQWRLSSIWPVSLWVVYVWEGWVCTDWKEAIFFLQDKWLCVKMLWDSIPSVSYLIVRAESIHRNVLVFLLPKVNGN